MRTLILLLSLFIFSLSISSYKKKQKAKALETAKDITKYLAKVTDSIYAWKYETSNEEYRLFQNSNNNNHVLDTANWYGSITSNAVYVSKYHTHQAFNNYPVVNVSYDNAIAYCNWLTEKYNADEKRKFKKVEFVLPIQAEWVQAATGGRKQAIYPWGNYYLRNRRGEYMCNIKKVGEGQIIRDSITNEPKVIASKFSASGGLNDYEYYTASVNSYWPNDYGIYNFSGNVSEMTSEKGISKGGSYLNYGGEVTISSIHKYTSTRPDLGFRVFMKVVEM